MSPLQPPDPRRSVSVLGVVGLLLTAGCLGPAGTAVDDPESVAQQVEARYDALDEYTTTIERTVSVGETTRTTRATVRFEKGESLRIAHQTGPDAGTVTVVEDPSPATLLSTDAAATATPGAETPASYGAFAGRLVESHNVTYRGTAVVGDRAAVVLSIDPTNATTDRPAERRIWIDAERRVPLRIESTWERESGTVTETIRFTNTSVTAANATAAQGGVAA
ncbi:sigma-E factor regulatory protein RseB domain-containing protein [Halorussus marinus]|uniref:sigma-E factor regulatory protein RseB domain-containing protein n=1 Tax=Halorussus marinus TaxID=2505976 RepID=UPI00106EED15|nr:outer membrane lipoprotein-sorting protein [Halorussus marinus]